MLSDEMNWKEVLKPTWNKLIVFILLGPIIGFVQTFFMVPPTLDQNVIRALNIITKPFFSSYSTLLPKENLIGFVFPFNLFTLIFVILDSFYKYVISCLIV